VEPVCAALSFPSSTYYAAKRREVEPSDRGVRDEELKEQIMTVWDQPGPGNRIYGARKIWLELNAAGIVVARCTVERLMRELGIAGVGTPAKKPRTTVGSDAVDRPSDLLGRDFGAAAPNARWVAGITYVPTASGWCYTALVMDLYSRGIAGWAVADHLRAELALDALEMGIWRRKDRIGGCLIHHSDRGVQ
jgi:putative transposase